MENKTDNIDKFKLFNRELYITIPEDDNINGSLLSNEIKSLSDSYNLNESSGKRFLSSSLMNKIEELTPVKEKEIIIDLDRLEINDSNNNNFNNIEINDVNKNLNDEFDNKINIENLQNKKLNSNIKKENEKEKNDIKNANKDILYLKEEEYIFEKFGKRGWQCTKCNNFNFESRKKCNRCQEIKNPKTLEQIKKETEEKNLSDKKKKKLIERKGDWQCPNCHNLNFSFRLECNRCHLSKDVYLSYQNKIQQQNNNLGFINNQNLQINFFPNLDFLSNMYNSIGKSNNDIKCNNNINNNKKFINWNVEQSNYNYNFNS